jgi:hypothetical protein
LPKALSWHQRFLEGGSMRPSKAAAAVSAPPEAAAEVSATEPAEKAEQS